MVLLEMSITPLGKGESVSQYVAECVELIDRSGLDYELHAMGTIVEGELDQVLDLMRRCIEQVATHSDRVTCAAKLDFRRGAAGRLKSKVASVEQKLGRTSSKGMTSNGRSRRPNRKRSIPCLAACRAASSSSRSASASGRPACSPVG